MRDKDSIILESLYDTIRRGPEFYSVALMFPSGEGTTTKLNGKDELLEWAGNVQRKNPDLQIVAHTPLQLAAQTSDKKAQLVVVQGSVIQNNRHGRGIFDMMVRDHSCEPKQFDTNTVTEWLNG
jgi:hypothetical protein